MLSVWDFFNRRVCLTTVAEEWRQAEIEFARVGLTGYKKFSSIPDVRPLQSFNKSTAQILSEFFESRSETLLFLEDDCDFQPLDHLGEAIAELPDDWDIVYLGANLTGTPERYSPHLFRISSASTTHCVGYNRKVIPFILQRQAEFSEICFDAWLSEQLPKLNAFVVAPMVAWQRLHYSTIWGKFKDYTSWFEEREAKLR
jgi:hypothetical protein